MSLSKMLQEYREGLRGLPTYAELAAIAATAPMTPERFAEKMDALDKANPAPLARLMALSEQCADPIVERNVSLLRQRSTVGVQKYGTTLADNKLPLRAWLNHALEEALDQANYLQAAMAEIDSAEHALPPLPEYFPLITNIRSDEEARAKLYAEDYARSALQAAPVQAQEPYGWDCAGALIKTAMTRDSFIRDGVTPVPLYTGPAQPVAVPDGWKLVPIEPTEVMVLASGASHTDGRMACVHRDVWKRMLEAAPAAPAAQTEARKPIMWAALNMSGNAVCVNQDKSACDIERLCIKTPTTIVPLCAGAPEPQ